MRICFLGNSHLTFCSAVAAARRGLVPVPKEEIASAELIIIAQDTETDPDGKRNTQSIHRYVSMAEQYGYPVVLQSQVAPGFCRERYGHLYHQPETLRIMDATDRAYAPECIVVGCADASQDLPERYKFYLDKFECPVVKMSYEDAEFSKIALNMMLASQVDTTNRLSRAARKVGANWANVAMPMEYYKRIGKYLRPGRWQDSIHLLRDYVTLRKIEDET